MSDPTQYSPVEQPKRKSKIPFLLLIAAVILGVVIWKMKSAGGGSETAAAMSDSASQSAPVAQEPAKPETTAMTPSTPKPETVAPPAPEKPVHVAKHHKVKVAASEPVAKPEPVVAPKAKPEPVAKIEPKPAPVVEQPKPVAPAPAPAKPVKKFALEDQPMPAAAPLSEESKLAVNSQPAAVEPKTEAVAAAKSENSDAFKQGTNAYHKQDYVNAVKQFKALPKPSTKQRGDAVRDQYVDGNFLLGLSLLRTDHADEAANAFLTVLEYEKYYPLANMNLGICYVELKQYFKANKAFESVVRDQGYIDPSIFDDVMQRTKYFWALAWTRMYKTSKDADKQSFYQQQAIQRWKDYQTWFGKNAKYRAENRRAEDYIKSLSAL